MSRGGAIFLAFCAGWMVYMAAFMIDAAHGNYEPLAFPFQVVIAVIVSGLLLVFSLLLGLIFKISAVRRFWIRSSLQVTLLSVLSLSLIVFNLLFGAKMIRMDEETGESLNVLSPASSRIVATCYFMLIFAIAHWPKSMLKPNQ